MDAAKKKINKKNKTKSRNHAKCMCDLHMYERTYALHNACISTICRNYQNNIYNVMSQKFVFKQTTELFHIGRGD